MKFKITYPSGSTEEVGHGAETVEAFVNEKFGSAYDAFVENGGTIEMLDVENGGTIEMLDVEDAGATPGHVETLYGSDTLNAELQVKDTTIQLGDLVSAAYAKSGLSVLEWNALTPEVRDQKLLDALEVLRAA